jgi:hypothetical protein
MVSKSDTGWAKVKLPDIGITLDLPKWPTEAPMEFDEDSRKTIKGWAAYDFASNKLAGDIYCYEGQEESSFSAEEMRDQEEESYGDERQYGNVKAEKGEFLVSGDKVLTLSVTYLEGIDPAAARCFFWKSGSKVGVMRLSWWASDDTDAKAIAERIRSSLSVD